MSAQVILLGDPPPTVGGDFERDTLREFRDAFPSDVVLIGSASIPTSRSFFYEYDLILCCGSVWDVIEIKCIRPEATIYEDRIQGINEFSIDRPFSRAETKAKVLASRLMASPFAGVPSGRVDWRVVVPNGTTVKFCHRSHGTQNKVMTVADAIAYYNAELSSPSAEHVRRAGDAWSLYKKRWSGTGARSGLAIGKYAIRRVISKAAGITEYHATDSPPVDMDVLLTEFAYDPLLSQTDLLKNLKLMAREMRTLRRIRHPYVACVTGHFQTGSSLVQISDWFEGRCLENLWPVIREVSLEDKIGIMLKTLQALAFCHDSGVIHRNVCAENILVGEDLDDLRVKGFQFAKDAELTRTIPPDRLETRDPRIIPPEDLLKESKVNPRSGDVFQAGVLFYRILHGGEWPFDSVLEYCTGGGHALQRCAQQDDSRLSSIEDLVSLMLAVDPRQRPNSMRRVEGLLTKSAGA